MRMGTQPRSASFQFTLPRGERHVRLQLPAQRPRFNSRSRVGSDAAIGSPICFEMSFNSRSRVGSDWL